MSKLNVDQKTIMLLFSDKKSDFLIPDYQRPYAWEEGQCQTPRKNSLFNSKKFLAKKQSEELLELAKKAVEIAIEER